MAGGCIRDAMLEDDCKSLYLEVAARYEVRQTVMYFSALLIRQSNAPPDWDTSCNCLHLFPMH